MSDSEVYDLMSEEEGGSEEYYCSDEDHVEASTSKKVPKSTSGKSAKKVQCHFPSCKRSYQSMDGYKKHLSRHVVEDLLTNAPGFRAVFEECRRKYIEVLQSIQTLPSVGGISDDVHVVASNLQAAPMQSMEIFIDCLAESLWQCLPSPAVVVVEDVHKSFVWQTHSLLSDLEKRRVLLNLLKDISDVSQYSDKTLEWFLTEFIKGLSLKLELFYVKCLNEPYDNLLSVSEPDRDNAHDINFQQSVHYIGGSAVHSVIRKARLGLGKDYWSEIHDCIYNKFLVKEDLPGPIEEVAAWTVSMDRGGLKHINSKVWDFLIALSAILKREEGPNGSILHENVSKIVTEDWVMMFLWNEITENSLREEVDLLLLRIFCEFFTNTWLRGVALRRKNAIPRLSRDKAALRSKLSS